MIAIIITAAVGVVSTLALAVGLVGGGARWERRMKAAIEASEQDS